MPAIENIKSFAKAVLGRAPLASRRLIVRVLNASGKQYCPICQSNVRRFLPCGDPPRPHAICPVCGSLERHRLDWLFFTRQTDLFDGSPKTMLHVAPEEFLSVLFRRIRGLEYVSADLSSPDVMVRMDITQICCADSSFSVIYCSHVLEHIRDDRKAIAELYRVLKSDGWALLQVPMMAEMTYEDPSIVDPEERTKHFGQWDHVRRCGPDYAERLRAAGFAVRTLRATDLATVSDCDRMGFQSDRLIFFCKKLSADRPLQRAVGAR